MSKADNMLSILWLLRSGKRMTAQELADELEVHVRTVYRCIDSLCASGVPIIAESGPNGGFQILGPFAEPPLLFDADEKKALVHASVFAREAGYPFTDELERAVGKLKRYTNEKQLDHIERHSEGISVVQPSVDRDQVLHLQLLEETAAEGRSVEMDYVHSKDGVRTRVFDPYGIVHWKGRWYTVGYCRLRRERRSFRVDRIARLASTDSRFERPADFSAKQFLLGNLLPGALDDDTLITVIIRGHEHALNELTHHWLFGHALTERKDGEATFRIGSSSLLSYVPYFLLSYGKALTVHEPEALVVKLAEVCRGMAEHYEAMISESEYRKG